MKSIKVAFVILIVGLVVFTVINGLSYINLMVSEKYEVQVNGLTKSPEVLEKAKERGIEINKEKKRVRIESFISVFVIIILLFIYFEINRRQQFRETANNK